MAIIVACKASININDNEWYNGNHVSMKAAEKEISI